MLGKDSNYVPGWDCHGLPIEWKIEEEYRAKGQQQGRRCRSTSSAANAAPSPRIGSTSSARSSSGSASIGDWEHPYSTMSYPAEAQIAREIMKFAANGLLYRGSKPVMWSVVEKTALAEAEVEYEDYVSDTVCVAFPVQASVSDRGRTVGGQIARAAQSEIAPELRALGRHLDDDALDDPRQPRDQLLVEDRLRALPGDGCAGRQLGEGRATLLARR